MHKKLTRIGVWAIVIVSAPARTTTQYSQNPHPQKMDHHRKGQIDLARQAEPQRRLRGRHRHPPLRAYHRAAQLHGAARADHGVVGHQGRRRDEGHGALVLHCTVPQDQCPALTGLRVDRLSGNTMCIRCESGHGLVTIDLVGKMLTFATPAM